MTNNLLSHPFLPTHLGTPSVEVWLLSSWLSRDHEAASHWSVAASHDPVLTSYWLWGLCRPWVKLLVEILSCLDRSGYLTIQIHFHYLQMESDSCMVAKLWKSRDEVIFQVNINLDLVRVGTFKAKQCKGFWNNKTYKVSSIFTENQVQLGIGFINWFEEMSKLPLQGHLWPILLILFVQWNVQFCVLWPSLWIDTSESLESTNTNPLSAWPATACSVFCY